MKNIISLSGMNMVGRPLILKMALLHDLEMLNDSNSPSLNNILGDPEVTANIYCKSRNLPDTDTQNDRTDMR